MRLRLVADAAGHGQPLPHLDVVLNVGAALHVRVADVRIAGAPREAAGKARLILVQILEDVGAEIVAVGVRPGSCVLDLTRCESSECRARSRGRS